VPDPAPAVRLLRPASASAGLRELRQRLSPSTLAAYIMASSLSIPDATRCTKEQSMAKPYAVPGSNVRIPRRSSQRSTSLGLTFWSWRPWFLFKSTKLWVQTPESQPGGPAPLLFRARLSSPRLPAPACTGRHEPYLARCSRDCACPPPRRPAHPGRICVLRSSLEPYSSGLRRGPPSGGPSRAWTACLPMCCDRLLSG
jgi:hypothetical protein